MHIACRPNSNLLHRWTSDFDRLFGEFFQGFPVAKDADSPRFPSLNFAEDEAHYYAEVEVPGVRMEDLHVEVVDRVLEIRGEVKSSKEEKDATYLRRERSAGSFKRALRLPESVDASKVTASLEGGLLTITLPKAEEAKPRKIDIKPTS